jgi:hypothetical protein
MTNQSGQSPPEKPTSLGAEPEILDEFQILNALEPPVPCGMSSLYPALFRDQLAHAFCRLPRGVARMAGELTRWSVHPIEEEWWRGERAWNK